MRYLQLFFIVLAVSFAPHTYGQTLNRIDAPTIVSSFSTAVCDDTGRAFRNLMPIRVIPESIYNPIPLHCLGSVVNATRNSRGQQRAFVIYLSDDVATGTGLPRNVLIDVFDAATAEHIQTIQGGAIDCNALAGECDIGPQIVDPFTGKIVLDGTVVFSRSPAGDFNVRIRTR